MDPSLLLQWIRESQFQESQGFNTKNRKSEAELSTLWVQRAHVPNVKTIAGSNLGYEMVSKIQDATIDHLPRNKMLVN